VDNLPQNTIKQQFMAIINHGKEFIFIHVPRTGGNSAYALLGGQSAGAMHLPRFKAEHEYYSFGFMRNPWDRMYSCYRKQKIMPKYEGIGFKEYLMDRILNNGIRHNAMYFLDGCDFIGRYENLQADWDAIQNTIGMKPETLPHLNNCGIADYRNHYDNEMVDFIALHHKADIEYSGYAF